MSFAPLSEAFACDPYAAYARLRDEGAPLWDEALQLWLLPRFDWVAAAALDKRLVRSPDGVFTPEEIAAERRKANWHDMPFHARFVQFSLLDSDGPMHDRLRKLVFRELTAAAIARLREESGAFVMGLLEQARRELDFVEDFAAHIPGHVIGRLLGAPDEDCERLRRWSENIVQYFDLDRSDTNKALAENSTGEFYAY